MFSFLPALIGMSAYQLNPDLDNSNFAFPFMATEVLPAAIGMIVLIAGLSATMSSASSDAIAAISIFLRDLYSLFTGKMPAKENSIRYSRIGLVFINAAALLFSLYATDIINYIQFMISIIMSGLFVCCIMGKYWKRANWQGGIASLVGGAATSIVILQVDSWSAYWGNPVIPAIVVATISGIAVSLFFPENTISKENALAVLSAERKEMEMDI
jgi:SSS family solute:Na+ symporter